MGNVGKPWRNVQVFFWVHSGQKSEPTVLFLAISASYLRPERTNRDTLKVWNHLLDMGNVGKSWRNVQVFFWLHSGHKCEPTVHSKSLKSSTWYGQCRKAMEKCSSLISTTQWAKNVSQLEHTWGQNDSNFRLCRLGENWFVRVGNFLGRSYCLHIANTLMYPLTADVPINRLCTH